MPKTNVRKYIYVYADWLGLDQVTFMGTLAIDVVRAVEVFAFDYDKNWLAGQYSMQLDPELQMYSGDQFLSEGIDALT